MRLGVDVGGTFTDLVSLADDGTISLRKVPTTPENPSIGLFRAVEALPERHVDMLVHGTTIATNTLLERTGARVVLLATRGFEDLLWLRRQDRASLYDLTRHHPAPLIERDDVIGVRERIGPRGVLEPLTPEEIQRVLAQVRARAPQAVAVALLFSFRDPSHERAIAGALREELGDEVPVAASTDVLPVFREFERTSTTVAEAYVRPNVTRALRTTVAEASRHGIVAMRVMTSSGGSLSVESATQRAASLALSGPAGGVVGAGAVARALGITDLLTLDMGGTSADASIILDGAAITEGQGSVAGIPIAVSAILIETVSAGGGSIAWVDEGGALKVGPQSAGAVPGPACYGKGGIRSTVTDACLLLGWLDANYPLAGTLHLDPVSGNRALAALVRDTPGLRDERSIARGIVAVATAVMARALKRISVARGVDPRGLALLPFGGAGPMFGCALAEALGMAQVVIPPFAGVLSALGLGAAAERLEATSALHVPLSAIEGPRLERAYADLAGRLEREVPRATLRRQADCRFRGQGYELTVDVDRLDPGHIAAAFTNAHVKRYGHGASAADIELANLRVIAQRDGAQPRFVDSRPRSSPVPGKRSIDVGSGNVEAAVWEFSQLTPGMAIEGPAVLVGMDATAVVQPGWGGTVHDSGAVVLSRV